LNDLGEQTVMLVRQEIEAAQREVLSKVKTWVPALGLAGVASVCGVYAGASGYRLVMRLLEKLLPPTLAALVASGGLAVVAVWAGGGAAAKLRDLPAPIPSDAAKHSADTVVAAVDTARSTN
jgi:hypothetical protein